MNTTHNNKPAQAYKEFAAEKAAELANMHKEAQAAVRQLSNYGRNPGETDERAGHAIGGCFNLVPRALRLAEFRKFLAFVERYTSNAARLESLKLWETSGLLMDDRLTQIEKAPKVFA